MKTYASKYDLNPEQATLLRVELTNFIGELMLGRRPPTMFFDRLYRDGGLSDQNCGSGN